MELSSAPRVLVCRLLSSCHSSSLSSSLLSRLVFHLLFSCLSSCLSCCLSYFISSSLSLFLSLCLWLISLSYLFLCLSPSLSPCVVVVRCRVVPCCGALLLWCVVVLCLVCCVLCCVVVWCVCGVVRVCDTLKNPLCPLNTSRVYVENVTVCSLKMFPCTPAPRAHVETTCARGAGTHRDFLNEYTGTFSMDTRGAGGGHRQFCAPKLAHVGLSRASEVHQRKRWILHIFSFENRSRTTCCRFLQSFASPEGNKLSGM